jgi:hypothetical protein
MKGLSTTCATPDEKVSKVEKGSIDVSGTSSPDTDEKPLVAIFYTKPNSSQTRLLIGAALYISLLCFLLSIRQAVNSVLHPPGDISIKSYQAGLASQGWKFGDDQLVDRRWLDRIVLEWASQEEGGSDTAQVTHHREGMKQHRCSKHGEHPHTIGPKEAEALFLTVPKNDSLAA